MAQDTEYHWHYHKGDIVALNETVMPFTQNCILLEPFQMIM